MAKRLSTLLIPKSLSEEKRRPESATSPNPLRESNLPVMNSPASREVLRKPLPTNSPLLPPLAFESSRSRSAPWEDAPTHQPNHDRRDARLSKSPAPQPKPHTTHNSQEKSKKKHWWSRDDGNANNTPKPRAWTAGHDKTLAYDVDGLVNAQPVTELWNERGGNCFVYLFPRSSGLGPSFKIDSALLAASSILTKYAFNETHGKHDAGAAQYHHMPQGWAPESNYLSTPPRTPNRNVQPRTSTSSFGPSPRGSTSSDEQNVHLYMPLQLSTAAALTSTPPRSDEQTALEDLQALVDCRNLFAFLCGQSLVATERRQSFFSIFMSTSRQLKHFEFSNFDGSTFGDAANTSFNCYIDELTLDDVRTNRQKLIDGMVLGEQMKSVRLYNEAFTHAVGLHPEIVALENSRLSHVSPTTRTRLTRAYMDLEKRTASVRLILTDFEFPFLFSGIMSSKTSEERKSGVRFDAWKESFLGMRKFIIGSYKQRYGDWPPKASSKKNSLETSGLNRLVLRDVYHDLSSLYDLLVDRSNLTTRTIDGCNLSTNTSSPKVSGLRAVLSEYDRSSPPVKPPMPFDLPRLPTLKSTRNDFGVGDDKKVAKDASKKIKDDEVIKILYASRNSDVAQNPFLNAFCEMERRAAHGCSLNEIEDLRIGQWIFMYVVLQALPMLACDAPGLRWIDGVEYFLCESPRGGIPWADVTLANSARRTWFSVGGGESGNVISLPSDVLEHGVEGIYHRSHCWQMAEKWSANNPILHGALHEQQHTTGANIASQHGLVVPPTAFPGSLRPDSRPGSRNATSKRLSSLTLGLEALPLGDNAAQAATLERARTPKHSVDESKTFDAILGSVETGKASKKKHK